MKRRRTPMRLVVRSVVNLEQSIVVEVADPQQETVEHLKHRLLDTLHRWHPPPTSNNPLERALPPQQHPDCWTYTLLHKGRELDDVATLTECGIHEGDTLCAMIRMITGPPPAPPVPPVFPEPLA
eukprot:TRINITY_DN18832_c0_g1_i1.p2 TRINITY_DN18832_c0_g1~~TRINITY_DN18832_c0_g1_i1.p2  ORF type:complete len:138 (+),score=29.39 TRINITY_DN18832_c0_g1_i1:42-416(+)